MRGITKRFPGVLALDHVNLELLAGEIHVLVGHNGAGKSTLIKILSGIYRPDEGEIRVAGIPTTFPTPAASQAAGIATIYQETSLCAHLSVYENLILGREPLSRTRQIARQDAIVWSKRLLAQVGIDLDPRIHVEELPLSVRQLVAIAKALAAAARILILDEPTAALPGPEIDQLFTVLRQLRSQNVGIIYVSHRLGELHQIGDRLTVFRDGRRIETGALSDYDVEKIVTVMVGDQLDQVFPNLEPPGAEVALEIDSVVLKPGGAPVRITARVGEIVGITGLIASGKEELAQIVTGGAPAFEGQVKRNSQPVRLGSRGRAITAEIGYLSSDRRGEAIILQHDAVKNVTLASLKKYCSFTVVQNPKRRVSVRRWIEALDIRGPGFASPLQLYSGGNQQKVSLAKWLDAESKVLVMVEPTTGLDVAAKKDVYGLLGDLAARGVTILLVSSDLEEVAGMSHRVVVLRDGEVSGEFGGGIGGTADILYEAVVGAKPMAGNAG